MRDVMAKPHNWIHAWTEEADAALRAHVDKRQSTPIIAAAMGRTINSIRGRAAELTLMRPSTQRPWRQGVSRSR